jgi:hypothetical protein
METQILNDLIKKYNIADSDIFARIVKMALLGEIKPEDLGYHFNVDLNMELTPAVELGVAIQFLSDEEKKQALAETEGFIKKTFNLDAEIKAVIYQNSISLDENLISRLIKLITSYLQDVRSDFDFKDALTRSTKLAGIGLTVTEGENLFNTVKSKKEEWQKNGINLKAAAMSINVQESEIDVASKVTMPQAVFQNIDSDDVTIDTILKQRAQETGRPVNLAPGKLPQKMPFVEEIKNEEEFLESTEELPGPQAPVLPVIPQSSVPQPVAPQPAEPPHIVPPPIRPPEVRQPLIRQADTVSPRPQMSDVKFEPKMYGPLDELAAMSLTDFRRLSKDPWQAIQKISGKLDILEGESMVRKNEGVKALKSSPLYNIYADIMNRALVEGKSFEQVIAERGDINITEFKAIMELNKSLKY